MRYTDFKVHLNISEPTISSRLDELQEFDLLEREYDEEHAPRVNYSLSPKGKALYERLEPLFEWAGEVENSEGSTPESGESSP